VTGSEIITRRRKWKPAEKAALLAEVETEGGKVVVVARRLAAEPDADLSERRCREGCETVWEDSDGASSRSRSAERSPQRGGDGQGDG